MRTPYKWAAAKGIQQRAVHQRRWAKSIPLNPEDENKHHMASDSTSSAPG